MDKTTNRTETMLMKKKWILFVGLILAASLWGCAQKTVVVTEPEAVAPEDQLYQDAENLYQAGMYAEALLRYKTYLSRHPQRPLAPAALLKIAKIFSARGEYAEALEACRQLLAEYPDSPQVPAARVEILYALYRDGQYDMVVQLASGILEEPIDPVYISRTYEILGDTYLALEAPQDAVYFYALARKDAPDDKEDVILEKMKAGIDRLDTDQIRGLLNFTDNASTRSYLMYRLGIRYALEDNYPEAVNTFSEFIEQFPDHEYAADARLLVETLSEQSVYQRLTIGCMLPLSGPYRLYGNQALKGIELAIDQIRTAANQPGIRLVVKDTASDADRAATAVDELIQAQVAAIVGPIITADIAAAAAQREGVPIVTITQKDQITDIGNYVFRNFLTPVMQVEALVTFATEEMGLKNFAILYPEEKYGRTFMNLFWDEVIVHGGTVVGVEAYDPSHTDFAVPIKKLVGLYYDVPSDLEDIVRPPIEAEPEEEKNRRPRYDEETLDPILDFEAVFIPDAPKKAGLIIPQLAFYDIEGVTLLGTNLWHSPKLIEMAKDYVQNAIITEGFFAQSDSEIVQAFVRRYETVFGESPGIIAATAYDTAFILLQAMLDPSVRSRVALKNRLLSLQNFQGVTGLTSFDETGDVHKQLTLLQVDGDQFVEVKPELIGTPASEDNRP